MLRLAFARQSTRLRCFAAIRKEEQRVVHGAEHAAAGAAYLVKEGAQAVEHQAKRDERGAFR